MKNKRIVKYIIFLITLSILTITFSKTYAKFVLTRQYTTTFSSYPFYFNATITNDTFNYNESGINVSIDIINYDGDLYNAFDTKYEIVLEDNAKFNLNNTVTGTINGNSKETSQASIKINPVLGANISGNEKINIIIRSTDPYYKEITIPITIKKSGALYKFMQDLANGQTDKNTNFYDPNIVSGVYMHDETKNDPYPVYYFRGNVNNSVIYAGHCWQIVRTTESGGLKLIYDGKVESDGTCTDEHNYLGSEAYNYKVGGLASPSQVGYKYSVTAGIEKIAPSRIEDMGKAPENITDLIPVDSVVIGKSAEWTGNGYTISDTREYSNISAKEIFKSAVDGDSARYTCLNGSTSCSEVYYLYKRSSDDVYAIKLTDGLTAEKAIEGKTLKAGTVFGHSVTWDESTKQYTLTNPITVIDLDELEDDIRGGSSGNYKDDDPNAFHYTCFNASETCSTVYYVYYNDYGNYHDEYATGLFGIKLDGEKNIKEKLDEMLYGSTNDTYSHAAEYINDWFEGGEKDWRGGEPLTDHIDELADDLWCNDRTIAGYHGWDIDADNHSSDNKYLHFDAFQRLVGEGDLRPTRPDITCDDPNDSFTVSNPAGNQDLKYPVAMLTADEAVLAGGIYGQVTDTYLPVRNGKNQFLMTPYYVSDDHVRMFIFAKENKIESNYAANDYAIRPAIVLKDIFTITSGNGTHEDPYQLTKN